MSQRPRATGKSAPAQAEGGGDVTVQGWEDDPGPAVLVTRPVPDLGRKPLAFAFPTPAPAPGIYKPDTAEFRYWTAAEALRRGADFWAPHVTRGAWQMGPVLQVLLDEGEDLNAYYDRTALNFFHGRGTKGTVYSGESPDVVCHEMGHAILDSVKPQLWNLASHEAAAFHEAFADISAILSALQLPSLCSAVLVDTQGHLYRSSRLSRLAEQLGAAIRLQAPDAVAIDCLRNAVNSFTYQDPLTLPQAAPASQLSSEPHSLSRVFSGAVFEIMGGLLAARVANPSDAIPEELAALAGDTAAILVTAVQQAPVVPNWYAQVAATMVQVSGLVNGAYPSILKAVFVRRSILSLNATAMIPGLQASKAAAGVIAAAAPEALATVALPASDYGLDEPLLVETASQPGRFAVTAAAVQGNGPLTPANALTAAHGFVEDLFGRGRVDYAGFGRPESRLEHGRRLRSHKLVAEDGALRLQRCLFDCGFMH